MAKLYLLAFASLDKLSEDERGAFLENLEGLEICTQTNIGNVTEFTARYPDGTLLDRFQASVAKNGERIFWGPHVVWYADKNSGEEAMFENGSLVGGWHSISNYPE